MGGTVITVNRGSSGNGYKGFLVGELYSGAVIGANCIYYNDNSTFIGWTEENINNNLGEDFTKDISNINSGLPILKWQK